MFGLSPVGSEGNGYVVSLGSFSTIFSPGLRMRCLKAPQNVLTRLKSRWLDDLTLCQRSISVTFWSLSFWNRCESSPSFAFLVPSWLTNAFSLLFFPNQTNDWQSPLSWACFKSWLSMLWRFFNDILFDSWQIKLEKAILEINLSSFYEGNNLPLPFTHLL